MRLGFFNSEADAEIALASLRSLYPAAFTSRAGAEDIRYNGDPLLTGRFEARPTSPAAEIKAPVVLQRAEAKPVEPKVIRPVIKSANVAPPAAQQVAVAPSKPPVAKAAPALVKPQVVATTGMTTKVPAMMSLLDPPPAPASAKERSTPLTMTTHQPFHVARGVDLPETNLELEATVIPMPKKAKGEPQWIHSPAPVSKPAPAPIATRPNVAAPSSLTMGKPGVARPVATQAAPAANSASMATKKPVAPPVQVQRQASVASAAAPAYRPSVSVPAPAVVAKSGSTKATDDYVPILDTTMTIRTLSMAEVEDANQPTWFSVQLAISEQFFNLDAMPRLDIFAAYRLYSVALHDEEGKLKHSLRLGFFKEEVSAEAVSGYLKTFFPVPVITRVSVAEYDRFIEPKIPEPPVEDKVVKLDEKRGQAQSVAPAKPTFGITPAVAPTRLKQAKPAQQKWNTEKPGYRGGPSGKYSISAVKKTQSNSQTSDSGIRRASDQRPQSFFSKLIGRELD